MAKYVGIGIAPDRFEVMGTGVGAGILGAEPAAPLLALETHNDMTLDDSGNLRMVYDAEAVGEHARQRLGTFKGEWFLDPNIGVDWFGQVLGFAQSRRVIAEAIVKRVILGTPGVTGLREMSTSVDRQRRGFYVDRAVLDTEFDEPVEV